MTKLLHLESQNSKERETRARYEALNLLDTALSIADITVKKLPLLEALIVDDNRIMHPYLKALLKKLGYKSYSAFNGQNGVDMYKKHSPTLVFMDIEMPVLDGFSATKQIRQIEVDENITPSKIICITGIEVHHIKNRAIESGMNEFACKPFSFIGIVNAICKSQPFPPAGRNKKRSMTF